MGMFFTRKVVVSAKNARRGHAFWQCPYCRKGQTGMTTTSKAVDAAREHMYDKHIEVVGYKIEYAR